MTLADNFLDFSYLTTGSSIITGAFFPYELDQSSTLNEYTSPLWSSIVSKTSYGSVAWLDLSDPIVEGDNPTITAIFYCDAYAGILDDFTLGSVAEGVFFDDSVGQWNTMTGTQTYDSIICDIPFDLDSFQAQQLFDIKQFVFYGLLLAIIAFGVSLLKVFIFTRDNV